MTKALMVNTATDLAGGDDGAGGINGASPTQTQGWGRINLGTVLDGTSAPGRRPEDGPSGPRAARSTLYYDVASARRSRCSHAGLDRRGRPDVGNSFVNDLDLLVDRRRPDLQGQRALRRRLGHRRERRPAQQRRERLPAGRRHRAVKVRVVATNIAGDGVPGNADTTDQDFALVVSNAGARAQPPGRARSRPTRTVTPRRRRRRYFEPGEPFTVKQSAARTWATPRRRAIDGTLTGRRAAR